MNIDYVNKQVYMLNNSLLKAINYAPTEEYQTNG